MVTGWIHSHGDRVGTHTGSHGDRVDTHSHGDRMDTHMGKDKDTHWNVIFPSFVRGGDVRQVLDDLFGVFCLACT